MSLCLVRIFIWPLPRLPGEVGRGYGLGVPVQPSYPTPALPGERGGRESTDQSRKRRGSGKSGVRSYTFNRAADTYCCR